MFHFCLTDWASLSGGNTGYLKLSFRGEEVDGMPSSEKKGMSTWLLLDGLDSFFSLIVMSRPALPPVGCALDPVEEGRANGSDDLGPPPPTLLTEPARLLLESLVEPLPSRASSVDAGPPPPPPVGVAVPWLSSASGSVRESTLLLRSFWRSFLMALPVFGSSSEPDMLPPPPPCPPPPPPPPPPLPPSFLLRSASSCSRLRSDSFLNMIFNANYYIFKSLYQDLEF